MHHLPGGTARAESTAVTVLTITACVCHGQRGAVGTDVKAIGTIRTAVVEDIVTGPAVLGESALKHQHEGAKDTN